MVGNFAMPDPLTSVFISACNGVHISTQENEHTVLNLSKLKCNLNSMGDNFSWWLMDVMRADRLLPLT